MSDPLNLSDLSKGLASKKPLAEFTSADGRMVARHFAEGLANMNDGGGRHICSLLSILHKKAELRGDEEECDLLLEAGWMAIRMTRKLRNLGDSNPQSP